MKYSRIATAFFFSISFISFSNSCERKLTLDDFTPYLSQEEIAVRVRALSFQVDTDYKGSKELVLVCVLKGALIFTADLMRVLETPTTLECIQTSSYGEKETAGPLTVGSLKKACLKDKEVLIVDDIYDTGNTLEKLKEEFAKQQPKSLKTCVCFLKNVETRAKERKPDYYAVEIEDKWVQGYGLDSDEQFRGLPGLWAKKG